MVTKPIATNTGVQGCIQASNGKFLGPVKERGLSTQYAFFLSQPIFGMLPYLKLTGFRQLFYAPQRINFQSFTRLWER